MSDRGSRFGVNKIADAFVAFSLILIQSNKNTMNNTKNITEKALSMLRSLPRVSLANLRDDPFVVSKVSFLLLANAYFTARMNNKVRVNNLNSENVAIKTL